MAKKLADVTSYAEAVAFLGNRDEKKIGNNTSLVRRHYAPTNQTDVAVRLHATDILTYSEDGEIVLNNGGYRTVTTKERMNAYLPIGYRVFQKDREWFVRVHFGTHEDIVEFGNHMRLPADPADYFTS